MNELHNFADIVSANKIVIPKIQRDYVQGSDTQQEKRDEFLAVLLEHLATGTEYHLDFIYGTGGSDQGEFLPLDGQQRLTTLFLVYWVLSQRAGKSYIDSKDFFSYQTRRSSELFCQKLITEQIDLDSLKDNMSISGYIKKESAWYLKQWETDPTIQAMLDMIDAVDTAINVPEYNSLWDSMCKNTITLLKFDCLNMKDYHLSDSLYVKMNERGKQLTTFENWKARFIKFLADQFNGDKYQYAEDDRKNYSDIKDYFVQSIEHQWSDIFWSYALDSWQKMDEKQREEKPYPVIDEYFERYIEYIHELHFYLKNPKINGSDVKTSDFTNKFSQQTATYSDISYLSLLFRSLDVFDNIRKANGSIESFFNNVFYYGDTYEKDKVRLFTDKVPSDLLAYCISNKREDRLVTIQILLYSIILYCQENNCYEPTKKLIRYVRVIRNQIDGVRQFLTKDLSYRSNIRLNSISAYLKTILHLCSSDDVDMLFDNCPTEIGSKESLKHEVCKNLMRNKYGKEQIDELEDKDLFHGNLSVLDSVLNSACSFEDTLSAINAFENASDIDKVKVLIAEGFNGLRIGWSSYQQRSYFGCKKNGWNLLFMYESGNAISDAFTRYVMDYKKYGTFEEIYKIHKTESCYKYYALTYDDFLKPSIGLYYFAGYRFNDNTPDDLRIIALSRANSTPLRGYHSEPFADVVVSLLKITDKNIPVNSWGCDSNRGFIHCESKNLGIKSYTDHWRIFIDRIDVTTQDQISLDEVFTKYKDSYNITWSEDKMYLKLPIAKDSDLVKTCQQFVQDLFYK